MSGSVYRVGAKKSKWQWVLPFLPFIPLIAYLIWLGGGSGLLLRAGGIVLIVLAAALVIWSFYRLIRYIRQSLYFGSEDFQSKKIAVTVLVDDFNDLNNYIDSLDVIGALRFSSQSRKNGEGLMTPFIR
jgi:hypothetical protein